MSVSDKARRTEVRLSVEGRDITEQVNNCLISFTYNDYSEDKADDISITFDDSEGKWLNSWLNSSPEVPALKSVSADVSNSAVPVVGKAVRVREGAKD